MAANILRRKEPSRMALIPFQISPCQEAAYSIQHKIFAKCQVEFLNRKPDGRSAKCGKIFSGEILKAARRQVPYVRGIGVGVMRTEMRRHDKNIGAISRDAVNFSHGARDVAYVLDDMRHVHALERVALDRPGKLVEIPNDVGGGARMNVDTYSARFGFTAAAADIENRQNI